MINSDQKTNQKPLYVNGKEMPFNTQELKTILSIIKKSLFEAEEKILKEDEEDVLDNLLNELN